jgi:hypothetical protein
LARMIGQVGAMAITVGAAEAKTTFPGLALLA